jgi:hypothetical protein
MATLKPDWSSSVFSDARIVRWLLGVEHHDLRGRLNVVSNCVPGFGSHTFKQKHSDDNAGDSRHGRR